MRDASKSKKELIEELKQARERIDRLETERADREESRRRQREKYGPILDEMALKIARVDSEGIVRYANVPFARGVGLTVSDILGKSIYPFSPPAEAARLSAECRKVLESGEALLGHVKQITLPDGRQVWAKTDKIPYLDGNGRTTGVVLLVLDITELKRAEEELTVSRLQLSEAMDLAGIVYWEYDPKSETYIFNDPFYALYGTTAGREGGYRMTRSDYAERFIHPDDRRRFFDVVESATREGGQEFLFHLEHRIVRRDGQVRHIIARVRGIKDACGNHVRRYGANQDVTERKQAEEALRESERQYRTLFQDAPIALIEIDRSRAKERITELRASGVEDIERYADEHPEVMKECMSLVRLVDVNRTCLEMYEIGNKEEFHRSFLDFLDKGSDQRIREEFLATAGLASAGEREMIRHRRRTGGPIRVLTRWIDVPGGEEASGRVLICDMDMTKWKEAEEALRASEEKYRDIFERAVEGIFQATPEGRFLTVNPAYARMLGYDSPEELMARIIDARRQVLVHPGGLKLPGAALAVSETQFYRKDGSTIWVSLKSRAVSDDTGTIRYFEGTAVDITERKHAEEERAKLHAQLRQSQKMEAIGTLAGGIAHDFNNILTALIGYGTLLHLKMEKADPLRLHVDQILSASQKAASLTQSLLAFSRQQPISLNPVSINDIVSGTEKLLKRLLTEDIILKISLAPRDHTIMADHTQVDQILLNLTTNARDAMPGGGTLVIETQLIHLDYGFKRTHGFGEPGKYMLLSVSDTGTGMSEATKEKIFEPFFTTKEIGKGTGLGLATVYGIVKQHDAFITVYSEEGMGTRVNIYFPAIGSAGAKDEAQTLPAAGGKETILVAEDDEGVRNLVSETLRDAGYTVIEAVDGAEAVEKFGTSKGIRLLILDSVMPNKNGREAYDVIKSARPRIKAIFMSGYTRDVVLGKGIEDSTFDFLPKPLQRNSLLEKVREVLDRKR